MTSLSKALRLFSGSGLAPKLGLKIFFTLLVYTPCSCFYDLAYLGNTSMSVHVELTFFPYSYILHSLAVL